MKTNIKFTGLTAILFLFLSTEAYAATTFMSPEQSTQQHWEYDPLPQKFNHLETKRDIYEIGYEDGYDNGYEDGYLAGLKRAKKDWKARKKRKQKKKLTGHKLSGWNIPKHKAAGNDDCYPYTFQVRGGKGSAHISTIQSSNRSGGISAKRDIKKGYVCFEKPAQLILSRYEGKHTDMTLRIHGIGKFTFTGKDPGWKSNNGRRNLRSAYWLLQNNLNDIFPSQKGWEYEQYETYK